MAAPKVIKAAATSATTIEVTFDQAMAVDTTFLDPASYNVNPVLIDEANITVQAIGNTAAQLNLPVNMKHGEAYSVVVDGNLSSALLEPMDPGELSAGFQGIGDPPTIVSATATDKDTIRVVFSEPMDLDDLSTPLFYKVTSQKTGATISIGASNVVDEGTGLYHRTDLIVGSKMTNGGDHTLKISNMLDVAGNSQAQGESVEFVGIAILPQVVSVAMSTVDKKITVRFDTPMDPNWATSLSAYAIVVDTGTAPLYYSAAEISSDRFSVVITPSESRDGESYTLLVNDTVQDDAGNEIDPLFNSGPFHGVGEAPTVVRIVAISQNRLDIVFSEKMQDNANVRDDTRYSADNGLSIVSVLEVDGDTVKLATSDQVANTLYTLTIS